MPFKLEIISPQDKVFDDEVDLCIMPGVEGDFGVDNVKLDGNTVSSTNTNGDLNLDANGTGSVVVDSISIRNNFITTVCRVFRWI